MDNSKDGNEQICIDVFNLFSRIAGHYAVGNTLLNTFTYETKSLIQIDGPSLTVHHPTSYTNALRPPNFPLP